MELLDFIWKKCPSVISGVKFSIRFSVLTLSYLSNRNVIAWHYSEWPFITISAMLILSVTPGRKLFTRLYPNAPTTRWWCPWWLLSSFLLWIKSNMQSFILSRFFLNLQIIKYSWECANCYPWKTLPDALCTPTRCITNNDRLDWGFL